VLVQVGQAVLVACPSALRLSCQISSPTDLTVAFVRITCITLYHSGVLWVKRIQGISDQSPEGRTFEDASQTKNPGSALFKCRAKGRSFMATPSVQPAQLAEPSLPDLSVLAAPAGHVLLFKARGRGVQIYPCDPSTHAFGPAHSRAILVTNEGDIIHHFKGPSWQAADRSIVVGTVVYKVSAPAADSIPWLLLSAAPSADGSPLGLMSSVDYIQRVDTQYGNPPSGGCDGDDAGSEIPVFYEAEYYFYSKKQRLTEGLFSKSA
jgi:hypothetical protein